MTTYRKKPVRKYRRKRAPKNARYVKRVVASAIRKQTELKYTVSEFDENNISTLNQSPDNVKKELSMISAGTDQGTRTGWEINLRGLYMVLALHNNGATVQYVRLMIVRPKVQSPLTLDGNLLANATGNAINVTTGATGLNAMYYPANKNTVSVLYSRVIKLGASSDSSGKNTTIVKKFLKLRGKVKWTGGAYNNANYGGVYLTAFAAESPDDTGAGQNVELSGFARLYYSDS